jgi:hypothetical protein
MANGLSLQTPQFSATNGRHIKRTRMGLGNRCSILLSYGAVADFLGFPRLKLKNAAQNAQRSL